jgi:hypothetical protein
LLQPKVEIIIALAIIAAPDAPKISVIITAATRLPGAFELKRAAMLRRKQYSP